MLMTLSGPYRTVHHRKLEVLSKTMSFQHLTEVEIHVGEWNASDAIEPESGWRQHVAHCDDFDVVAVAHVITVNANQKLQENVNLPPRPSIDVQHITKQSVEIQHMQGLLNFKKVFF